MRTDEGMMNAARVMRDAAETNQQAADRIEEAVRQMQMIFDAGYGGTATQLLEKLTDLQMQPALSAGMRHELVMKNTTQHATKENGE